MHIIKACPVPVMQSRIFTLKEDKISREIYISPDCSILFINLEYTGTGQNVACSPVTWNDLNNQVTNPVLYHNTKYQQGNEFPYPGKAVVRGSG